MSEPLKISDVVGRLKGFAKEVNLIVNDLETRVIIGEINRPATTAKVVRKRRERSDKGIPRKQPEKPIPEKPVAKVVKKVAPKAPIPAPKKAAPKKVVAPKKSAPKSTLPKPTLKKQKPKPVQQSLPLPTKEEKDKSPFTPEKSKVTPFYGDKDA
jgi:hypothetical protein